jgi:hypothetical protein
MVCFKTYNFKTAWILIVFCKEAYYWIYWSLSFIFIVFNLRILVLVYITINCMRKVGKGPKIQSNNVFCFLMT